MTWQVTAWRLAAWDTPLWVTPNGRSGRYNRPGSAPTQYTCLHPWGPWAELLRRDGRRSEAEIDVVATRVWTMQIRLDDAPRRVSFDTADAAGLDPADLIAADYSVCQRLADDARRAGERALLVPSAALPGTENLVLFGPAVATPWDVEPIDDVDIPCAVLADRARPPASLTHAVCYRDQSHAGVAAWRSGAGSPPPATAPIPLP